MRDLKNKYEECIGIESRSNKYNIRRTLALLLTLGLGVGGVCAAAEDSVKPEAVQALTQTGEALSDKEVRVSAEEEILTEGSDELSSEDIDVVSEPPKVVEKSGEEDAEIILDGIETVEPDSALNAESGITLPDGERMLPVSETPEANGVQSGECGARPGTVYWNLDEAGVLTISGNGPMADWESAEQTPWYSNLAELKGIVIGEGVTTVGAHAFCGAQTVEAVEIAQSVECVGAFAFFRCGGLGTVTIG